MVEDHSYRLYHIVDGQQRLTTFVIFVQAFIDFVRELPEHASESDEDIFISDSLSVADVQEKFLFKTKPTGDQFRTYKFGYTTDNPSYNYLRYRILHEPGSGTVEETFYTLNLSNARHYFMEQFSELYEQEGSNGLLAVYKKLTKSFLFNEYVIKDEFDMFVAFETMNNRGKGLSALELLKNRLIYLTTLYDDEELDAASRNNLRTTINEAWKEIYHQLGRNKLNPLNDDDFLRAHWTMYFKYSRQTGRDYSNFLLNEQFTQQKVHRKIECTVRMQEPEEQLVDEDFEDLENEDIEEDTTTVSSAQLRPTEIRDYVNSLKESVVHWFDSFFPHLAENVSDEEQQWIDRMNRVGMTYFRPLVMTILKKEPDETRRIETFKKIERFIFIAFRLTAARSNYRSSEFYIAAREVDRNELDLEGLARKLDANLSYTFNKDGTFRPDDFYNFLYKKFESGGGYYGWSGLRYFLYEYELSLLDKSIQKKVDWSDLLKPGKDRITIEHIYPQVETEAWASEFGGVEPEQRRVYRDSLGNMLLLSGSINSSLQNDAFADKKSAKYDSVGNKVRNGYEDGSHSEIEVSKSGKWGSEEIHERGLRLLQFMEQRWNIPMSSDDKERLLFPI